MVSDIVPDLAAKHPIGPPGIHQDYRQQRKRSNEEKCLRPLGGRRFPQRKMIRHDHRIKADGDTDIRQDEETNRTNERQHLGSAVERAPRDYREAAVAIGTGARSRVFGHPNQRDATV